MSLPVPDARFDWDIFCRVVDNFGDIGVTLRLARGLAADHGLRVRLWVDDWQALARLCPAARQTAEVVRVDGVELRRWGEPFPPVAPAAAVIEAFACELPAPYVAAMAARVPAPLWINLEYLSAEAWVEDCHGLRSPHPRLPLVKHFWFPGFTARTGGLLREPGLLAERDAFCADPARRDAWLRRLGGPAIPAETRWISLFAYEQPKLGELLQRWADASRPTLLLVPEGRVVPDVLRFFGQPQAPLGSVLRCAALTVVLLPFLDGADYDRLLWSCDLNFVRGEDSAVRAHWAARPFVWQLYPQRDDAHHAKLDAFLARLLDGMAADCAAAVRGFWRAWNGDGEPAAHWPAFEGCLPDLAARTRAWSEGLAAHDDLVTALVKFSELAVK